MASATQLPPLSFSDDLPVFLVPPSDDDDDNNSNNNAPAAEPAVSAAEASSSTRAPSPAVSSAAATQSPTAAEGHLKVPPRDPMRLKKKLVRKEPPPPRGDANIPVHPIPSMQNAFAESLLEVTDGTPADKPKLREVDAKARREALIHQDKDAEPLALRWRYRPGQTQHELWKLMAQISFGVYLLLNGMANSNAQVVSILQGHIDEVDEFLEVAMEDFKHAATDLQERIEHLRLPTENIEVFETMLEDRNFRAEIVEGNEMIEHVLARTTVFLKQYEEDVQEGLQATKEFAVYLAEQSNNSWRVDAEQAAEIYAAMKGNTDGWFNAFRELQTRGKALNALVTRLTAMVASMEKKAGEVSRRTWVRAAAV
jgi:hypothetical protein